LEKLKNYWWHELAELSLQLGTIWEAESLRLVQGRVLKYIPKTGKDKMMCMQNSDNNYYYKNIIPLDTTRQLMEQHTSLGVRTQRAHSG
jgi:hypothetical protein